MRMTDERRDEVRRLRAAGLIVGRASPVTDEQWALARRLREEGLSLSAIAARLEMTKQTIWRLTKGVPVPKPQKRLHFHWEWAERFPPAYRQEHLDRVEALRAEVQAELTRLREKGHLF